MAVTATMKRKKEPYNVRLTFEGEDLENLNDIMDYMRIYSGKHLIHHLLAEKAREIREKAGKKA